MHSSTVQREYICPGENHAISYSVHLGRLANFYPVCRTCPYREDTGSLPPNTVQQLQETTLRVPRKSLLSSAGLRGMYLNDLTSEQASEWAKAFADLLWYRTPRQISLAESPSPATASPPVIVIGHDERPNSRVIFQGVLRGLTRMSCVLINLGQTLPTVLRWEMIQRKAAGGLFVTGHGFGPAWTGMDFFHSGGVPVPENGDLLPDGSSRITLQAIEERTHVPLASPARTPSRVISSAAESRYEEFLRPWFHALRPLRIALGSASRGCLELMDRRFTQLPCRLSTVDLPIRARNWQQADDADVIALQRRIRGQQADLGLLIDEDQSRCQFLDEQGQPIPSESLFRLLAERHARDFPQRPVLVDEACQETLIPRFQAQGIRAISIPAGSHGIVDQLQEHQALLAGGQSGEIWFAEPFPFSDAVLTLAAVLQLLSQQDVPFSQLVAAG